MKVTAIFDIGKTNKKCILFDEAFREVKHHSIQFAEIEDDDGFHSENLEKVADWIRSMLYQILEEKQFSVEGINFSGYGASLVCLDKYGKPLRPYIYNYLKPYPPELLEQFYSKYGEEKKISSETASPPLAMLNSGLQLYFLKKSKPDFWSQISCVLHLPQFLSYLISRVPLCDYTSLGCHTMLWNYSSENYHQWIYSEKLDHLMAPLIQSTSRINLLYQDHSISVGPGIHDSSAALVPYLKAVKEPFILLSTGTWSIAMNPFNQEILSQEDLQRDCLNFMDINGRKVKASRLFLGNEYALQVKKLCNFYQVSKEAYRGLSLDKSIYRQMLADENHYFAFESIKGRSQNNSWQSFTDFRRAFHQLMYELVLEQIDTLNLVKGDTAINTVFVDGGFANNNLFLVMLTHMTGFKIQTTKKAIGSSLGAAIVMKYDNVKADDLNEYFHN